MTGAVVMNTVYLLTGGNLGDRAVSLHQSADAIAAKAGAIVARSSIYETAAWGGIPQPDYLNQVLELQTERSPEALLQIILQIETTMGRKRSVKYGPRIIDIDILLFNDLVFQSTLLTIPHPQMHLRRFVMEPMAEIAPQLIHPALHQTMLQLLEVCPDSLDVKKYSSKL